MRKLQRRTTMLWPLAVGALALTSTASKAVQVDLASGDNGTVNGALFVWTAEQPTGTGYIDPFVRIQGPASGSIEQGYNTSGRPFAFDEKDPLNFTRDIQLRDLGPAVNIDGNNYYQFLLDVNEAGGQKAVISLDSLMIFTSANGSQTVSDPNQLGTLRYDLDAGADSWILLDASRNSGSGSGDMFAYIPSSLFADASPEDYLYLYSKFGVSARSEAGFEEWAMVRSEGGGTTGGTTGGPGGGGTTGGSTGGTTGGPSPVPEPSTYALLGTFLALAGWFKTRKEKSIA